MPKIVKSLGRGLYEDQHGRRAVVKVGRERREKRYPPNYPADKIRAWQEDTRKALRALNVVDTTGTLADDAPRYLDIKARELASIADRRRHVELWVDHHGHLRTADLVRHANALNATLTSWRVERSASTCNHRRDAICDLVKVIIGRRAGRARRDELTRFRKPDPVPRALPRDLITDVLSWLTPGSKTRARLTLMHWTGMRPSQMARLTPESFAFAQTVPHIVVPRGKGGRVAFVPLTHDGQAAAEAFIAANAWGAWSCPSANKSLTVACRKAGVPAFTLYVIRHSFATALRQHADLADVQAIYGHTDPRTMAIYAEADLAKQQAAIARLAQ